MVFLPHVLIAILLLVLAPWDIWEYRRLRAAPDGARIGFYVRTSAALWVLIALSLFAIPLQAMWAAPAYDALLLSPFWWRMLSYLVLFLMAVAPWLQIAYLGVAKDKRERALKGLEALAFMLPRNGFERGLFALLCLSAGIGEEIIFRGFVLRYLLDWHLGLTLAVIGSSLLFGLAHAGQGGSGIVRTGLVGLILALLYLATGSLLLPIVAHASIDLQALVLSTMRKAPQGAAKA